MSGAESTKLQADEQLGGSAGEQGQAALGVGIDEQHLLSVPGKPNSKIVLLSVIQKDIIERKGGMIDGSKDRKRACPGRA
jgi:hypothetical protein